MEHSKDDTLVEDEFNASEPSDVRLVRGVLQSMASPPPPALPPSLALKPLFMPRRTHQRPNTPCIYFHTGRVRVRAGGGLHAALLCGPIQRGPAEIRTGEARYAFTDGVHLVLNFSNNEAIFQSFHNHAKLTMVCALLTPR